MCDRKARVRYWKVSEGVMERTSTRHRCESIRCEVSVRWKKRVNTKKRKIDGKVDGVSERQ